MVKYGSGSRESMYITQCWHHVATELPQHVLSLAMQLPYCHHKAITMVTRYSHRITSLLTQSYHTSTTILGAVYASRFVVFL